MTDPVFSGLKRAFILVLILAQLTFATFPGLDLVVSHGLADGAAGFAASHGALPRINALLRTLMELIAFSLVLATLVGWIGGHLRGPLLRCAVFAAVNLVLGPGVIVNLVLKAHIGRARPVSVEEFGGTALFTPAWQLSDQCAANCSFTSGEVALAASLAICAVVLFWPRLGAKGRLWSVLGALTLITVVSALRLSLGRHFLSDAVFSVLISAGVALATFRLLNVAPARSAMVLPDLQPLREKAQIVMQTIAMRVRKWLLL